MRKRNVRSATWRLHLYMFSLSTALHFLSLGKIVYFKNIFFIFLYWKTFLPVWNHQWRVRLIIRLVCTSVPLVYLNVLWIIRRIKALGWQEKRREVHRYREWAGSALNGGVTFSFHGNPLWGWCGPWGFWIPAGRMDLPGRAEPGKAQLARKLGRSQPWGCCAAKHVHG